MYKVNYLVHYIQLQVQLCLNFFFCKFKTVFYVLQCDYCNPGHLDKVDQSDYMKITTQITRKLVVGQSAARKKKQVS